MKVKRRRSVNLVFQHHHEKTKAILNAPEKLVVPHREGQPGRKEEKAAKRSTDLRKILWADLKK